MLLAVALVYTSFSASTEAKQPSELLHASPGQSYEMTGVVVPGSIHRHGSQLDFRVADRDRPRDLDPGSLQRARCPTRSRTGAR